MYNKKYYFEKIEPTKFNPIHEELVGSICYPAYLKPGERGWLLFEYDSVSEVYHKLHTSTVQEVIYNDDKIVLVTANTTYHIGVVEE